MVGHTDKSPGPRSPLTRDRVLQAAIAVADDGGIVQAERAAHRLDGIRRGRLAEHRRRDIARQDLGAGEDQHGDQEDRQEAERHALEDQPSHCRRSLMVAASWRSIRI